MSKHPSALKIEYKKPKKKSQSSKQLTIIGDAFKLRMRRNCAISFSNTKPSVSIIFRKYMSLHRFAGLK